MIFVIEYEKKILLIFSILLKSWFRQSPEVPPADTELKTQNNTPPRYKRGGAELFASVNHIQMVFLIVKEINFHLFFY